MLEDTAAVAIGGMAARLGRAMIGRLNQGHVLAEPCAAGFDGKVSIEGAQFHQRQLQAPGERL